MSLSDRIFGEEDWQEIPLGFIKSSDVQEAVNELINVISHLDVLNTAQKFGIFEGIYQIFGEKLIK